MRIYFALLLAILAGGCASDPSNPSGLPGFTIAIDSDPRGVRVEVNNEFIGMTPTNYLVRGNADRSFNGSWVQQPNIVFTAFPPHDAVGLYVQKKSFSPSAFFKQGDHIPEKLFFDMHLPNSP